MRIHLPISPAPLDFCPMEFVRILDSLPFDQICHFLLRHSKKILATTIGRAVTKADVLS